jgi:ABC-2 type transport system permease protein
MLRFYLEVARTAFRRQLVYRWANLAGLATNIFFGVIVSYVYIALFQANGQAHAEVNGFTLQDTLRYIWLVQALIMVVLPFGWFDLMLTIRSGEVVSDLSKPSDFFWYWFSRESGRNLYYLLFRCIPTYLAGMLLFGFGAPTSWDHWLAFAVSLLFAASLGVAYRFLYNILAFWVVEARAAGGFAQVIALFFGGSYVPVVFFPVWLRATNAFLPFSPMFNVPAQVFTGALSGGALALGLSSQVIWVVVLILLARVITARALTRVVVQGG